MLEESAGFIVESLEEGITVVERILLPKFGPDSFTTRRAAGGALRLAA